MRRPYLIAESPQVTVLRSLASTAFGKVNVTLPEGAEMGGIFTPSAPGNELGYVAALDSKKRVGGMFRRFVRADVDITAKGAPAPASDVEQVLDEAAKRTSGEFFLESDITLAGLGDWVPLQDFHVGDLVDVEIWSMVVPMRVTRVEPIVSDHSVVDWRVHVGGQLVSDEDALLAANATIHRVLVEDRRDLAGLSERVVAAQSSADAADQKAVAAGDAAKSADSKAVAAGDAAKEADGKAKKLAEALSGRGASIPTVMADLQRLNRQLQENDEGGAADQGLIPAYIAANTKRWELQDEVNNLQEEFRLRQREWNENKDALDRMQSASLWLSRESRVRTVVYGRGSPPLAVDDGLSLSIDKPEKVWIATVRNDLKWPVDATVLFAADAMVAYNRAAKYRLNPGELQSMQLSATESFNFLIVFAQPIVDLSNFPG